ncbi:MAG TPA: toll/interleukin-1 receptor domain-containing protein [Kofleriaceae bacterium]|nr:toll/interleukin-1 receptor domain-containing protein [Kofleriaceae bacterium]
MAFEFQWLRTSPDPPARPTMRVPLSIYVLWHPAFADGPLLARTIAEWCTGGTADIRATGQGIPVHFRSDPWRAANAIRPEDAPPEHPAPDDPVAARAHQRHVWRRPVELDEADHNVFVPLVEDNLVDDPSWRRDLLDLARRHRQRRAAPPHVQVIPIQVTPAWARLPDEVNAIQAVFLRRWTDIGQTEDERRARWIVRIRRLLTQALVRLLGELRPEPPRVEVFLSHAKADLELGPGVAEQLRDVAAGYGQIEVFYDENDLPSGRDWERPMLGAAAQTAGFIAVLSDRYATRYWCRREIQQARTPVRMSQTPGSSDHALWAVRPSVVAVTMAREWSRLVGELGTVPAIMWRPGDPNHAATILDQLFREALIAEFQLLYARQLYRQLEAVTDGPIGAIALITWTPDASTLIRLRRQAGAEWSDDTLVVYPGHGFLPTEEEDLAGALGPGVEFRSFEQFSDSIAPGPRRLWAQIRHDRAITPGTMTGRTPASIIALSAGDADDLAALGYDAPGGTIGSSHLDVAVLRICRAILGAHLRIAFGGNLRSDAGFTQLLHDTVAAMSVAMPPCAGAPLEAAADPETPLENWVVRTFASDYTPAMRASLAGLCRFYFIGEPVPPEASSDHAAAITAASMSRMRAGIARRTAITVAIAGKRGGSSAIMPGVAEEILCAMEASGPDLADPASVSVLLIGEYGGAVREIVRYIVDPGLALPSLFTFNGQEAHPSGKLRAILRGAPDQHTAIATRYDALARCLGALRTVAALPETTLLPRLGITVGEWRAVMMSSSVGFTRRLLKERILPVVAAAPPRGG